MSELQQIEQAFREPLLHPVDRVSEMIFGLFMALTFGPCRCKMSE
jgi:hypothetical protein